MAEIDKLLDNMVAKGVERVKIASDQPILLQRGEQQAQGPALPLTKIFGMLREIAPSEHRAQLATDCQFKFPYNTPSGYFDIAVSRHQSTLVAVINFVAPASGNASVPAAQGAWSPTVLPRPNGHEKSVARVIFSPDGASLASAGLDGFIKLWHSETGELHKVLRNEDEGKTIWKKEIRSSLVSREIVSLSFSPKSV